MYLVNKNIEVTSPTYNIIQSYRSFDNTEIIHMDFYRLNNKTNIYDLDIIESFEKAITIIEWPERLSYTPLNSWKISLTFSSFKKLKGREVTNNR